MRLTQHEGHFKPDSLPATTWPGNKFNILLPDDAGVDVAQAICGQHGIIDESRPVAVPVTHDDMIGRLLDFEEIAQRAPDILGEGVTVQAGPRQKFKTAFVLLPPHHVYAIFDGWRDALKTTSGETCRVEFEDSERGFKLTITPDGSEPIVIESIDQTRDRVAERW